VRALSADAKLPIHPTARDRYCEVALWQDSPKGMALFRAVTAYTENTHVSDIRSRTVAFTFMIACISSNCHGQ
jgi:hypothetical protein